MFTVLRRFAIPMTLMLEKHLLGTQPNSRVYFSVFLMMVGSVIAALSDLAFDLEGYVMILLNDFFTAMNGVVMKKTVNACAVNKWGVLFHSSWVRCVVAFLLFS